MLSLGVQCARQTSKQLQARSRLSCQGSNSRGTGTIGAGERVLLQYKNKDPILTKILRPDSSTDTRHGYIKSIQLIGKRSRDTVTAHKGAQFRIYRPTLAEYVALTPRVVTPIYSADANLVVSLLDIHVEPLHQGKGPLLEILEAGTGNGALTLHLARAIHAANPASLLSQASSATTYGQSGSFSSGTVDRNEGFFNGTAERDLSIVERLERLAHFMAPIERRRRQAIIHTLDISQRHSEHAQRIVSGFRQGIYANDVDFHVGDVSGWIDRQMAERKLSSEKTFLSHVILDMPDIHQYVQKAASVLHVDGNMLAFNPSITQIIKVVEMIKLKNLPLELQSVLELGSGMTGGREWDVRMVIPKKENRAEAEAESLPAGDRPEEMVDMLDEDVDGPTTRSEEYAVHEEEEGRYRMVCRPKVGGRIVGGGFLGVWKKMAK